MEIYTDANILLVSETETLSSKLEHILAKEGFFLSGCVVSVREAKHIMIDEDIDLIIIDMPLTKDDGAEFAMELLRSKLFRGSIIMLIDRDRQEHNLYQAERMGIITIHNPLDTHLLLQTIRLLLSFQAKIKKLESKADQLEQKLRDDRLVSRAKVLLIAQLKMQEEDAHHYIEKMAMDRCVKKTAIAQEIIRMYEIK